MSIFFGNIAFTRYKKTTEPLYSAPKNVQQMLDIYGIHENGTFEIERPQKRERMFDRCYEFPDINYIDRDDKEKEKILLTLCRVLNSLNTDFKFLINVAKRDQKQFRETIMSNPQESPYPALVRANNRWIEDGLKSGHPELEKRLLFVVTCRRRNLQEAELYFETLETTLRSLFQAMGSNLHMLNVKERLKILHDFLREDEEDVAMPTWEELIDSKKDWRNLIVPYRFAQKGAKNEMCQLGETYTQILFAPDLPNSLDESKTLVEFSRVDFPVMITLDYAPIPQSGVLEKLQAANMDNERTINSEQENKMKNNIYSGPSYIRTKKKEELEEAMEQIQDNDEHGFFLGFLIAVKASTQEELQKRVGTLQMIAKSCAIPLIPYYDQQLQALNTVLPTGARRVLCMRPVITSSAVVLHPYFAQDIIEPGGFYYGTNMRTKNIVLLNRKRLKSGNGVILGHTGAGKSFLLKETEIGQTLIGTADDIFAIDPQNELEGICKKFEGQYLDLGEGGVAINFLEIPEKILYSADPMEKNNYIRDQSQFLQAWIPSIMRLEPTGYHITIIDRCCKLLYERTFAMKHPRQPLLPDLYQIFADQDEPEARDIYGALEAFVTGTYDLFSKPTNFDMDNRFVAVGMKKISSELWEAVMIAVMRMLSLKIESNVQLQKATRFIVDEAQFISRSPSSAAQLQKAILTYRKYGGIVTLLYQNISAMLANETIREIISNCDFKLFLDQGGADQNALAEIMDLSESEFNALGTGEVGKCLISWGGKIILCDATMSKKNPLYQMYSTNFHEKAAEGESSIYTYEAETPVEEKKESNTYTNETLEKQIIQVIEALGYASAKDLAVICAAEPDEIQQTLDQALQMGHLVCRKDNYYLAA